MKSEWRLFGLLSAFLFLAAVVYGFWTKYSLHGVDWIGTTALVLCGLLTTMCTLVFFVVSRRIDPGPEDGPDADISDAAGEVVFFNPGSYGPFWLAVAGPVARPGVGYPHPSLAHPALP